MAKLPEIPSTDRLARERLNALLEELSQQGYTQQQIAAQAGLSAQQLSDLKRGHRSMSELVARRLGEAHQLHYQWLLGISDGKHPTVASTAGGAIWLPVFAKPIEGKPRTNSVWDGSAVEVAGTAAAQLARAQDPYVLRYGRDDIKGRIRRNDLILISQANSDDAEIHVAKYRGQLFLARRSEKNVLQRVANGTALPANSPCQGHCLGVLWSALVS